MNSGQIKILKGIASEVDKGVNQLFAMTLALREGARDEEGILPDAADGLTTIAVNIANNIGVECYKLKELLEDIEKHPKEAGPGDQGHGRRRGMRSHA